MPRTPPKRKLGWGKGHRSLNGEALDVRAYSGWMGQSELQTRSQIARGVVPYHRLGGRIIFLRSEVLEYLRNLPGVSPEQAKENLHPGRD